MPPKTLCGPIAPAAVAAIALALVAACGHAPGNLPTSPNASNPTSTTPTSSVPAGSITANPCTPSGVVQLAAATTAKFDCSNGGTTVTLAGGGASYFVLTQFAGNVGPLASVPYRARWGAPASASSALAPSATASMRMATSLAAAARQALYAPPVGGASALPARRPGVAQLTADRFLRQRALRLSRSGTLAQADSRLRLQRVSAAVQAPPAAGTVRAFHLANSMTVNTYTTVNARLAYVGANLLLYVDTLAPAGFTADQLTTYGKLFDQTLYPVDTAAFGAPSDIDSNGHFIMVMSPVVNALSAKASCSTQGFVAGFFDPNDFSATDPNSNLGEIFYSIVPDPSAQFSCVHSVADVGYFVPATFLHELQHLINFSQHSVLHTAAPLDSWLDEGMSIVAEELGSLYYERKCPPPSCRTNAAQLFPDSSQGFVSGFLYDSYEYALLPDTASILVESDNHNGSAWRGGAWLLTRWLADQFGDRALRALETGPSDGLAAISAATGQPFPSSFADFGIALYTDSLPGLPRTTAPAANRFTSRNPKALWARLFATSSSSTIPNGSPLYLAPLAADTSKYVMLPGTMAYWRLDTPASSTAITVQFSNPAYGALAAALKPQIVVFRLPPGQ